MPNQAALVLYYLNLLILQYKGKPRAEAQMRLFFNMILMDLLPFKVSQAYDLYQSSGYELDVIGKYQNVQRTNYTFSKQVTLDDDSFRTLILLALTKHYNGSSLYDIDLLINQFFGDTIRVYDYGKMRMSYMINTSVGSNDLAEIMITTGLLPKPMAVTLSSTIRFPVLNKFFGYSTAKGGVNPNNSPYNLAEDYHMDRPWISYRYIVGNPNGIDTYLMTEFLAYITQEDDGKLLA